MPNTGALALSVLSALDVVVLIRRGPKEYSLLGTPADFYLRLCPPKDGKPCENPWNHSARLRDFLQDAENFFSSSESGFFPSGEWIERLADGRRMALTATAMWVQKEQAFILRRLSLDSQNMPYAGAAEAPASGAEAASGTERDALSGLYTEQSFIQALDARVAEGDATKLSLLFIDIDELSDVNSMFGMQAGDVLITEFGPFLQQLLRRGDVAGRFRGGTFGVFAPFTQGQQTLRMAEKLRSAVAEHSFAGLPPVTVSVGCTTFRPGESYNSLISRAKAALTEAKLGRKNIVRIK